MSRGRGPEVKQARAEAEVVGSEAGHVGVLTPEVGGQGPKQPEAVIPVQEAVSCAGDVDGVRGLQEASGGQALGDGVTRAVAGLVTLEAGAVPGLGGLGESA